MQTEHFFNLTQTDWTVHNQQVLKYCKELADKAVLDNTADYPAKRRLSTIKGVLRWDLLDHYLEQAANNNLFEEITAHWIDYQGAQILELRGQYTNLTACHVLSRDDKPKESADSYRKNNRAKNQKNQLLFKEIEEPVSDDDKCNLIFLHGGHSDNFAYLMIFLEDSDIPPLSENIMLLPDLEMTPATEIIPTPMPTLKGNAVTAEPELSAVKISNDHSQS